jgi:hypothetical protein
VTDRKRGMFNDQSNRLGDLVSAVIRLMSAACNSTTAGAVNDDGGTGGDGDGSGRRVVRWSGCNAAMETETSVGTEVVPTRVRWWWSSGRWRGREWEGW